MITLNFLRHFVEYHAEAAYILIFLGVILEGEIVVIFAGIFAHLGSLNFFISLLCVIMGGGLKSVLGYALGSYINRKHSHIGFVKRIENRIHYFFPKFRSKPFWSIFISRFFILGLNWFTLVFSGFSKVNLRTYIKAEALSLMVWAVGVLSLGYFFSYTALSVSRDVRKFLLIILFFFLLFFIIQKIIAFMIDLMSDKYRKEE